MANKRFMLAMLVMALVFGMTVVGCGPRDTPEEKLYLEINNHTDDPITEVVFSDRPNRGGNFLMQDSSGIPAHSKKAYDPMGFGYYITLKVRNQSVPLTNFGSTPVIFLPKNSGENGWQFYLEKESGKYQFINLHDY